MAGVFLVSTSFFPAKTFALTPAFQQPKVNPTLSPLQENQIQIDNLKAAFEFKKSLIAKDTNKLQQVQAQVQQVSQTKDQLKDQVDNLQDTVKQLQAQVDAKKAAEAARIVHIGQYAANAAGNDYAPGNCTWYVKSRRPDLPNDLGNANTWYYNAAAQGWKVGTQARTGAVGTTTAGALGHVVYVEAWYPDGTILISEMNYAGLYSQRTRIANESDFVYIYEKP